MDVGFAEACRCYSHKSCVILHFAYRATTRVAHTGSQAADELRDHIGDGAFVCDASFDAFGNEFRIGRCAFLSVSVAGAFLHRADRSHAAI